MTIKTKNFISMFQMSLYHFLGELPVLSNREYLRFDSCSEIMIHLQMIVISLGRPMNSNPQDELNVSSINWQQVYKINYSESNYLQFWQDTSAPQIPKINLLLLIHFRLLFRDRYDDIDYDMFGSLSLFVQIPPISTQIIFDTIYISDALSIPISNILSKICHLQMKYYLGRKFLAAVQLVVRRIKLFD